MRKTCTVQFPCKVCGETARYSYYGAIVCQSCKVFFKRNAEYRRAVLKCYSGNECEININNRHICSSCRLAKCFVSGMCIELIRSSQPKLNRRNRKRKLTNDLILLISTAMEIPNKKHQVEQIPTSNILQSDQASLTIDQWNLLSNIVRCFDEHSGYSFVDHFINEQNALPPKLRFKFHSVCDFFTSMMTKVQFVFEKYRDLLPLSLHDRITLLRNTVEYTATIGGMFILRQARLLDNVTFFKSAEIIFQTTAMTFTKHAIDQFDSDDTFNKIILAVIAFSTINYTKFSRTTLINIKTMLPIQDMYTELAWRYLLHKYDHYQAVIRFSNLLRCLLLVNDVIVEAYKSKDFSEMIDSVVQQTEKRLSL